MNLKYGPNILESTKKYIGERGGNNRFPSVAELACYLDVTKKSISNWRKKYDDFDKLINKLLLLQEDMLIELGLTGAWNSNLVKLLLCNHGYGKDQEDQNQRTQVNLFFKGIDREDIDSVSSTVPNAMSTTDTPTEPATNSPADLFFKTYAN